MSRNIKIFGVLILQWHFFQFRNMSKFNTKYFKQILMSIRFLTKYDGNDQKLNIFVINYDIHNFVCCNKDFCNKDLQQGRSLCQLIYHVLLHNIFSVKIDINISHF